MQTTSKYSQRYYTTKRLIRDLLSNTPNCLICSCWKITRIFIYGGCVTEVCEAERKLAREIQQTDWSTAGNLSNRSSGVQIPRDICTRFGRYLYSTKCSWIINYNILTVTSYYLRYQYSYLKLFTILIQLLYTIFDTYKATYITVYA